MASLKMVSLLLIVLLHLHHSQAESFLWVRDSDRVCILGEMDLKFAFQYTDRLNGSRTTQIEVPSTPSTIDGSCGNLNDTIGETLAIKFFDDAWTMAMGFDFYNATNEWFLSDIDVDFLTSPDKFPGANGEGVPCKASGTGLQLFGTSGGWGYSCPRPLNVTLPVSCDRELFAVSHMDVVFNITQLEAFRHTSSEHFGHSVQFCADNIGLYIAIVCLSVSAALIAGLVLVCCVRYARRRWTVHQWTRMMRQGGYEEI